MYATPTVGSETVAPLPFLFFFRVIAVSCSSSAGLNVWCGRGREMAYGLVQVQNRRIMSTYDRAIAVINPRTWSNIEHLKHLYANVCAQSDRSTRDKSRGMSSSPPACPPQCVCVVSPVEMTVRFGHRGETWDETVRVAAAATVHRAGGTGARGH